MTRIFLSWSGERSRRFANALRDFLKEFGFKRPWVSEHDLIAGARWADDVARALRQAHVCIACVTPENMHAAWLAFELGAVRRRIPLLIGLDKSALTGPLASCQSVSFNRREMLALVKQLRPQLPAKHTSVVKTFDKHWPGLENFERHPLDLLFDARDAAKAPFLLASAVRLWGIESTGHRAAIAELTAQLENLKQERDYLEEAAKLIRRSSVWAICGTKTDRAWTAFLRANVKSHVAGRRVERVFFPPATRHEWRSLRKVINAHLGRRMKVRVLQSRYDSHYPHALWHLPHGFGMTLMGKHKAGTARYSTARYERLDAVLVHWGGVTEQDPDARHFGVLLRHPEWTQMFWGLFDAIRKATDPVGARTTDVAQLQPRYPKYQEPSL